ncbi:MAG: methylated-DNA--[protein]-cysteine S-methyltransferase [Acidimicrobiales bacterium]
MMNDTETINRLFDEIARPDPDMVARLHQRLVTDAESDGLLDISYRTVDSPYGALLLAATTQGLVRIAFALENHDAVLSSLATTISPRILQSPRRLDRASMQLDEYFAGKRHGFELSLDLQLSHGFRRNVLDHLRDIAYGHTASYAAIAAAAGSPAAVRAVGSACATNPLPIVVPCHRVVRSDGSIGQYLGGTDTKRALLAMEAAH